MSNRRFLLTAIAAATFATLLPAFPPRLAPAAPPPAAAPAVPASRPATAPATRAALPRDKTVGKQLTAAITELTVWASPEALVSPTFGVTLTNTSQTDLTIDLKEAALTLHPMEKGAPGQGVINTISIDGKSVHGTTTTATLKAGQTSVIRYSAPGLPTPNSAGMTVYVTLTFTAGNETLSVRKSVTAQALGPKGD